VKITGVLAGLALLLYGDLAIADPSHACAANAVIRAKELLAFYRRPDDTGFAGQWSVDESAKKIGTVAAIHGKRRYDVLEVWGNVYKGSYRMRFIYAVVGSDCVLMGEEILEDAAL
jgi:hypothetical protein